LELLYKNLPIQSGLPASSLASWCISGLHLTVKASSIIKMSKSIEKELQKSGFKTNPKKQQLINKKELQKLSKHLAEKRNYPVHLGDINFESLIK